eukprot:gb/GECH01011902.1/.p1 GENE.gb/GECH01011902.1/~~gb/GECH01011902.1/.p1  ORF type:complete len:505 (+),score=118.13 gb/GECH01011902.1/:1-1515(+)
MGNVMDKRAYRHEHHDLFRKMIDYYEEKNMDQEENPTPVEGVQIRDVNVFVRRRPVLPHEQSRAHEFEVVKVAGDSSVIVHKCMPFRDLKPIHAFIESQWFPFPEGTVFDENASNQDVYDTAVSDMVRHLLEAGNGERGTLFVFGQTGSGKTHTVQGIMDCMAASLFDLLEEGAAPDISDVSVVAMEMLRDTLYDIMNDHSEIKLLQGKDHDIHLQGASETPVTNADDLWDTFQTAADKRETHATAVNTTSSRSHFIFRIILKNNSGGEYARLTVVDLAGSERNADSAKHDRERQKESAWINSSLMALKDVMRTVAENQRRSRGSERRIPFRESNLTKMLRDCFDQRCCTTVLISTVSPISVDTEHTINTLSHVGMLTGEGDTFEKEMRAERTAAEEVAKEKKDLIREEKRLKPVQQWTPDDVQHWLHHARNGQFRKYAHKFSAQIDGRQLGRFSEMKFTHLVGDARMGRKMRESIMNYTDKVNKEKKRAVAAQKARMKGRSVS